MSTGGATLRTQMWEIDRWRKSDAYREFGPAEQACYRNLLDELCLRGGVLPRDEGALARATGFPDLWPDVRAALLSKLTLTEAGYRQRGHDEVQRRRPRVHGSPSLAPGERPPTEEWFARWTEHLARLGLLSLDERESTRLATVLIELWRQARRDSALILRVIDAYFEDEDPWVRGQRWSVSAFQLNVRRLVDVAAGNERTPKGDVRQPLPMWEPGPTVPDEERRRVAAAAREWREAHA